MNRYLTMGLSVLAGAALLEAALIPGIVIGGAAVLAPKVLPKLRRRLQPLFDTTVPRQAGPMVPSPDRPEVSDRPEVEVPRAAPARLEIKQAVAKTITFRIIVTTLDFTTNYVVIGEFATAAGLSAFALVVGPLFYLSHEAAWNYFGPSGTEVDLVPLLPPRPDAASPAGWGGITISRALAKTITFRTIATAMDFTANYVVVGELATAVGLSAFGFVLGPFVYFGHEKAWEYYGSPRTPARDLPAPTRLLPAPAAML
jgi:uncharacterized membrane protein